MSLALGAANAVGEIMVSGLEYVWDEYISSGRFERKLARIVARGSLRVREDPVLGRIIEITEQGRREAAGGRDMEKCLARDWDERWCVASFDVPENERRVRDRLRRTLRALGFGHLQDSVWVSPDPPEFIRQQLHTIHPDARNLTFSEFKPAPGQSNASLVRQLWDVDRINRDYRAYLEILRNRPRWYERKAWEAWLRLEWRAWKRAVSGDPFLPSVLLPDGYLGRIAWAERCEVFRSLHARNRDLTGY